MSPLLVSIRTLKISGARRFISDTSESKRSDDLCSRFVEAQLAPSAQRSIRANIFESVPVHTRTSKLRSFDSERCFALISCSIATIIIFTLNSAMAYQEKQLQEISKKFQIYGEILHAETLKIGHINETYSATYSQGGMRVRYIHQKINKGVFKNPVGVMKNVMRVATHIRRRLEAVNARDITRRSLIVIPTRDGQSFYRSSDGEYWRT